MSENASASTFTKSSGTCDRSYSYASDISYSTISNESVDGAQLKLIFEFFTRSFGRKIGSSKEVMSTVSKLLRKLIKAQDDLGNTARKNAEMMQKLQDAIDFNTLAEAEVMDDRKTVEIVVSKLRSYKRKLLKSEDQSAQKSVAITNLQAEIEKLKHDHEVEMNQLRESIQRPTNSTTTDQQKKQDDIQSTAGLFEELVVSQEETIQHLLDQRKQLVNCLQQYEQVLDSNEEKNVAANETINKRQAECKQLTQTIEQMKEDEFEFLKQIYDEIPTSFKPESEETELNQEHIIDIIRSLLSTSQKQSDHTTSQSKEEEDIEEQMISLQKYNDMVSHLEDAVNLIRNVISSSGKTIGEEVKTLLLAQCSQIGEFIDENIIDIGVQQIPEAYSIFDPHAFDGPEKQYAEFLKFATEEQMNTSPVRELFAVFCGITDVNLMLLDYIAKLKKSAIEMEGNTISPQIFKNLQNQNFDLLQCNSQATSRVEELETLLRKLTGKEDIDINLDNIIEESKQHEEEKEKSYQDLMQQKEGLLSTFDEYKASSSQAVKTLTDSLTKTKESLSNNETLVQELTQQNQLLEQQLQSTQEEYQTTKTNLTEQLKQKSIKCQQIAKSQKDTCQLLDSIQQRTQKLLSENEILADECIKLQEIDAKQKEEIKALEIVEKKLRNSRDHIKARLVEAQNINKELFQGTSTKKEFKELRTNEEIATAQHEAEETRKECENLKRQLCESKIQNENLQHEVSMAKVQEKSMSMKLSAMTKSLNEERSMLDRKAISIEQALKAKTNQSIKQTELKVEECRKLLLSLAGKEDEGQTFDEAASELQKKFSMFTNEKKILNDATKTRTLLGIKMSQSLYDAFMKVNEEKTKALEESETSFQQMQQMQEKSNRISEENELLQHAKDDNYAWLKWARKIETELTGDSITDGSIDALQKLLSEAILLGKGNHSTLSHLTLLRDEKKILQQDFGFISKQNKIQSLTSLTKAFAFLTRLQTFSGHVPSAIPGISRFV